MNNDRVVTTVSKTWTGKVWGAPIPGGFQTLPWELTCETLDLPTY